MVGVTKLGKRVDVVGFVVSLMFKSGNVTGQV